MFELGLGTEVLIILSLIVVNGVFAMSEIAVISARKTRLRQRAKSGDTRARRALELAEHPNRFLSTAQIGITLVGIFAGAYGGATVARSLSVYIERVPALAPASDKLALFVVVLSITFLSLVLGELVPKRIALIHPERIASRVAEPMHRLSVVASPVVRLLSASTDAVLGALRIRKIEEPPVTEEEVTALILLGTEAGIFEEAERDLVERVFRLGDLSVASLMTPREGVVWLDLQDPMEVNRAKMMRHRVQRFPVCEGGLDNVLGMAPVTDLWARMLAGAPLDLRASLRRPLSVPETMRALRLLELFRQTGVHLALVVDSNKHVTGLVTLTDILNEISGDLLRHAEPRIIQREDGSWLMDGSLSMQEVWRVLRPEGPPEAEESERTATLGGLVTTRLGRIPISGEYIEVEGYRFEVVDMDGRHVDKVLASRRSAEAARKG
jgi:putative hemolysin